MKFLVLSDLHLEFAVFKHPPDTPEFDAIILAGDVMARGDQVPRWAARASQFGSSKPIVFVPGNHEFYDGVIQTRRRLMGQANVPNVHVLDPGVVLLDDGRVRVIGCTLWTDFSVPIATSKGLISNQQRGMDEAAQFMSDYRAIDFHAPESARRHLQPADTLAQNQVEREWLLATLHEPFAGTTVVVTHHGPSAGSVAEQWADDWLTPSFVSDLPDEYFEVPALWVHGHTHTSLDYMRGRTRIVCNPRGYRHRDGSFENPAFQSDLVIDTASL